MLNLSDKRRKPYQKKKERERRKNGLNRFETRLSMVAKFPDTSRHRDQGRAETQTKARGCRGEGRGERDKYSNVVFMEVHRRGALEGAATRRRHCFPRSGNILGSWSRSTLIPRLLSTRIFNFHCRRRTSYRMHRERPPTTSHFHPLLPSPQPQPLPLSTPSALCMRKTETSR